MSLDTDRARMDALTKKKILLLDTGKEWGGGTNSMLELLAGLDRQLYSVVCCLYQDYRQGASGPRLSERLLALGVPFVLIAQVRQPFWAKISKELVRGVLTPWPRQRRNVVRRIDYFWRILPNAERLCELLSKQDVDLLYMNNQASSNLEGYLAAERLKLPVVQHARIDVQLTPVEVNTVNRVATRVICNSNGVRFSLIQQGVDEGKCVTIYNGFNTKQSVTDDTANVIGRPVIGTIGSLVPRKCIEHLISLGARLKIRYPEIVVLIVGEGPHRVEITSFAEKLGMRDSVFFAGFQSQVYPWLKAMDVFVFPSRQEGFGKVLLEAMFVSVPVLAANVVGPNEVVTDGVTGLLYPHGDIEAMERSCCRLLEDRLFREAIVSHAKEAIEVRFSMERYVASIEGVFTEVLMPEGSPCSI